MCMVISVVNQKGGVGKTTTTFNLGVGLVRIDNKKVLIIDSDPQGSLTAYAGYMPDELDVTLSTVYLHYIDDSVSELPEVILSHKEGIDILPANIELADLEVRLINALSREIILSNYISSIRNNYDVILIDCLPSLSNLTINALAASDSVLIPTSPSDSEDLLSAEVSNEQKQI